MPPTLLWGIGIGLVIAAIDTIAGLIVGSAGSNAEIIDLVDWLANIALYSLAGLRVGRATGVVRAAAEAGVIAGAIAGGIAIVLSFTLRPDASASVGWQDAVGVLALNVAIGGILAWLNGWIGTRANESGKASRR
ncbi:MAG: hypothetical protein IT305_14695 [Chloroflexi bacterium]|nr:hypothetical protein [Chloroflexota bacterium]